MPDPIRVVVGYPLMGGLRLADAFGWPLSLAAACAAGACGVVWFAGALARAMPW